MDRRQKGQTAESLAAAFLQRQGVHIALRNYRCRFGELDLVAIHDGVLLVVEVRTRASDAYGGAAASVDSWKRHCIIRTATFLLQQRPALARLPVRFDVVVVSDVSASQPEVRWFKHAFDAEET